MAFPLSLIHICIFLALGAALAIFAGPEILDPFQRFL